MAQSGAIDLDAFYSSAPLSVWRQVLGEGMHYHHGIWEANENWDAALENAVLSLARPRRARRDRRGSGMRLGRTSERAHRKTWVLGRMRHGQPRAGGVLCEPRPGRSARGSRRRDSRRDVVGRVVDGIPGAPGTAGASLGRHCGHAARSW